MATYDLAYPGAAIDAILNTSYFLQEAGYIFQGSASEYSGTPSKRVWLIAPAGFTGFGITSPVPKGSIGICLYNGTAWVGKAINVVTIDSSVSGSSDNAVSSSAVYAAINHLATGVAEALDNLTFTDTTPSSFLGDYINMKVSTTDNGVERILTYFTILAATTSKAGLLSAADKVKIDSFLTGIRSMQFVDATSSSEQAIKLVEQLKWTVGGVQEVIDSITLLAATSSKAGLLSAADKAYIDALPATLTSLSNSISGALALMQSLVGYYVCDTAAGTAAKTVAATGYSLTNGGCIRIKMTNANTANNVTLNINSTGAKALFYEGEQASATNTWEDGEVLEVYYDGTRFMASNSQGGGGKAEKIKYDNSQSGLAAENVQEALDEVSHKTLYNNVKCTRSISMKSPKGETVDNHGVGLEVGKRYKFVINTSTITSDSLAVRLYQTSNKSSDNIKIGVFPTDTNQYTCYYTPEQSTNYQYFGLYKNQTTALDADCIVYEYDTNVTDKFNDIDDNIYLEKPFEQGTIGTNGTTLVDVDTLIRSADFISIPKQVTIQAKDGYYIRRVFAYNPDGTLNALLNIDAVSSYTLNNPSLKYKFTVQKGTNEDIEINPDEDCMVWTSVKKLVGVSDTQGVAALNAGIRRIFVAAADSTPAAKAIADYQCTGVNDELVIQEAINSLTYGGTVQLLDGQYNIDSFPTTITWANETHHVAIFVTGDSTVSRTVNLIGTTENKSYNSHYGAHIHVSQSAISNMNNTDIYTCIRGTGKKPTQYGDYTRITNMNFANFYLYIGDAEKKIRGIDCTCFGGTYIKQVGVYTEHYFYYRFNHLKPSTPVVGSIGVVANSGSNDEMARVGWDTLNCGGMYIGVMTQNDESGSGIDHLIMKTCTFARCVYGMYFKMGTPKTMTIINCCDEGCTHLPYFGGTGHITAIDFNVERFNNAYYPDDPTGNTEFYAVEETPGSWIGSIEYTLQGWSGATSGNSGQHFWKNNGSGKGIRTRNLNSDHTGYSQPNCGEYLEQYFDTTNNVWKTWNGSAWV